MGSSSTGWFLRRRGGVVEVHIQVAKIMLAIDLLELRLVLREILCLFQVLVKPFELSLILSALSFIL